MPRVALITGGEGDLATAIRTELLREGWEVHAPGRTLLDVTKPEAAEQTLHALPRVDYLIHCAGILRDTLFSKMGEEDWDTVMAVNLKGVFEVTRLAYELHMHRQKSGHILVVGSNSARFGNIGQANYASAKAGLIGLMQSFAREYGMANVRVNAILPGFLATKLTAHLRRSTDDHVLRRLNTAEEVARFVAFLDSMAHTSGQVFQLDSRIGREL